jgi:hypothetical protein
LAGLEFGVKELAIHRHLKAAAAGGDELEVFDLLLVGGQQLGRQTDGLGLVVSHGTVFDLDLIHVTSPFDSETI